MVELGTGAPPAKAPAPAQAGASLWAALILVALIFGFVGLLSFGRGLLAVQVGPGVSVYVCVMVALTLGVWVLSWAYMRRVAWLDRRDEGWRADGRAAP